MSHANHLNAERLQAFLEGDLSTQATRTVEAHLGECARCSAELEGWRVLFEELGDLKGLRPHEGFAERILTSVEVAETPPLHDRVWGRVSGLDASGHLAASVIQDFVDGALLTKRAERVERHLDECGTCAAEAHSYSRLGRELQALESFAPRPDFGDRVLANVDLPRHASLAARLRERVGGLIGETQFDHVPGEVLQEWMDGTLHDSVAARVDTHIDVCASCAAEAREWRKVVHALGDLDVFAPSRHFETRVMAMVRMRLLTEAAAPVPLRSRSAAFMRRLIPDARRAVAALSGLAVTPAVVLGLVAYAVFSHPALTFGSLASFFWWQLTDAASAMASVVTTSLLQLPGADAVYQTFATAPLLAATGLLLYSAVCLLAVRSAYRLVVANRTASSRYAHVSTS